MKKNIFLLSIFLLQYILFGCGGKQETNVTVKSNKPPVIIKVSVFPDEIQTGSTVLLECTAIDEDGDLLNYYWTVTDGVLSSTTGIQVMWTVSQNPGKYNAIVMVSDGKHNVSGGVTITVTPAINNNRSPIITSGPTATPSALTIGQMSTITVSAFDPDADVLSYNWTTTGGTISGTGSSVSYTAPSISGSYTISVIITDGKGGSISNSINLLVLSPQLSLTSISIIPSSLSISVGGTKQFYAIGTYSDNSTVDLTSFVVWSSSNTSVGEITSQGLFTAKSPGTTIISAKKDNITSNNVTVQISKNQSPSIVSLIADPTIVGKEETSTITVVASDPDGDTLNYSWSATGGTLSGSGSQVIWTAPQSIGTYTITVVVSDGKGGSATGSISLTTTDEGGVLVQW